MPAWYSKSIKAGLPAFQRDQPAHYPSLLLYSENWEDMEGYSADIYLDVTDVFDYYLALLNTHALMRERYASFRYYDYYEALGQMRGCLGGYGKAVTLMRTTPEENKAIGEWIASRDLRIGSIVLKSTPLPAPDESMLTKAITDAIQKEGMHLLNWEEEVQQWQNRVLSLRNWRPELKLPDVHTDSLLVTNNEWLSPYLVNIKKPTDLKKLNLKEILHYSLTHEQQQQLEKLAPEFVTVPSGSEITLQYQSDGSAPVLAVRLPGRRFDCGSKLGYLQASIEYGLRHPDIGEDFARYLKSR